ncbi:hypothetical protein [Candidatus Coxiella mudrowiae]|uniref:hypothetical protein n=1 Tax=Candidatus Coxiella mudrowiae TaxID=2054173 RepID=UPI001C12C31E|nr:hypothetical protein [Candidatus Coxiella mudrowiae]
MIYLLLINVRIGFALVKVSVYSSISLITQSEQEHASFASTLEGIFMIAVLSGYWIFSFFINSSSTTWLDRFWLLGELATVAFILLATTRIKENERTALNYSAKQDFNEMIELAHHSVVIIFIISILAYVFIEQSISTWCSYHFNNKILRLSPTMSVEMASIL